MPCYPLRSADGTLTLLCVRGHQPRAPCVACGRPSSRLCDHALDAHHTCDAPLCQSCTQRVGRDGDRCPAHHLARLAPTRQGRLPLED
jgi:hypothetical protein